MQELRVMGNPDALMNLLNIFNMIDSSGDGQIDPREVAVIASLLGYR
jgi:hypothetical protein